jgi:hypothetical protein
MNPVAICFDQTLTGLPTGVIPLHHLTPYIPQQPRILSIRLSVPEHWIVQSQFLGGAVSKAQWGQAIGIKKRGMFNLMKKGSGGYRILFLFLVIIKSKWQQAVSHKSVVQS